MCCTLARIVRDLGGRLGSWRTEPSTAEPDSTDTPRFGEMGRCADVLREDLAVSVRQAQSTRMYKVASRLSTPVYWRFSVHMVVAIETIPTRKRCPDRSNLRRKLQSKPPPRHGRLHRSAADNHFLGPGDSLPSTHAALNPATESHYQPNRVWHTHCFAEKGATLIRTARVKACCAVVAEPTESNSSGGGTGWRVSSRRAGRLHRRRGSGREGEKARTDWGTSSWPHWGLGRSLRKAYELEASTPDHQSSVSHFGPSTFFVCRQQGATHQSDCQAFP